MADNPASTGRPQASRSDRVAESQRADHEGDRATFGTQNLTFRPKPIGATFQDPVVKSEQSSQATASLQDDGEDEGLEGQDHGVVSSMPPTEEKKNKKKKKRKPAGKRGLDKPTGFEDFFADAPLTPEEYAEEQELYASNLLFIDRILTAISRFERTRKLTPERRDIFYKYLAYGGLTVGPNVGQGGVDTEGMTKTQIATALSQVFASKDKHDLGTETSLYEVDFLACIKGFISRRAKNYWGIETKEVAERICTTLERFMDYLLQHDVCPEYKDDVLASRTFCRASTAEVWDTAEAIRRLPGEFNIACSTLFGGSYAQNYDGETWWGNEDEPQSGPVFVGMKTEEAQQVMKFGVAGAADERVYLAFLAGVQDGMPLMLEVIDIQERASFEITSIEPPTDLCKEIYITQSTHFRPVGRVIAKPWRNPDAPPEDLTQEEREHEREREPETSTKHESTSPPSSLPEPQQSTYTFFMEQILQDMLRVGTKIEATVRILGCGIMFFDDVLNVYPSFDIFVHNEMMLGWKSPRPVKGALDHVSGNEEDGGEGAGDGGGDGEGGESGNPAPKAVYRDGDDAY